MRLSEASDFSGRERKKREREEGKGIRRREWMWQKGRVTKGIIKEVR